MHGHGGVDGLAIADVPQPSVRADTDVLIRLKAAALNHLDIWTLHGLPGLSLEFPHILGGDGAGIVEEVGSGVTHVTPGDRVMLNPGISCYRCRYCLAGEHSLCVEYRLLGEHVNGTLAEYIVVPWQNVYAIPKPPAPHPEVTWGEAAAYSLVTLTAWRMLMKRARLKAGEVVLIWGAGGGVSIAALKVAKLAGAFVIVTSSSEAKLELARSLGADVTLNHATVDVVKEVRAAVGKSGVDIVVENVGQATWDRSLRLLGRGGRLVSCGATTGPKVTVDVRRMFWYQWDIMGSTMGSAQDYREIIEVLARGHLRPTIDSVFPLDQGAKAVERLIGGEHMGKVVVEM